MAKIRILFEVNDETLFLYFLREGMSPQKRHLRSKYNRLNFELSRSRRNQFPIKATHTKELAADRVLLENS